jgi:hypothetical protein
MVMQEVYNMTALTLLPTTTSALKGVSNTVHRHKIKRDQVALKAFSLKISCFIIFERAPSSNSK